MIHEPDWEASNERMQKKQEEVPSGQRKVETVEGPQG